MNNLGGEQRFQMKGLEETGKYDLVLGANLKNVRTEVYHIKYLKYLYYMHMFI